MTDFEIHRLPFDRAAVNAWSNELPENTNWPVVYTINNNNEIYVGETTNAHLRLTQHLNTESKKHLSLARVIYRGDFNKSACLDLESHLIRYFAADDKFKVLNGNGGITESDYYQREAYRESFQEVFDALLHEGALTRSIPDIVNSDLFKYSPFKALNTDQAIAIESVLEKLFEDIDKTVNSSTVIQGDPGTGKTIVAIYIMKLIRDIALSKPDEAMDENSLFADFFQPGYREKLQDFNIGLVIPQISLRRTVENVFAKTPGLSKDMILDPFEVGSSDTVYDLLIVDETHRLQQRANQAAAERNIKYKDNNIKLFGQDADHYTQLDWIKNRSKHQIFLLDKAQSVKPADVRVELIDTLVDEARSDDALFPLTSQMRVAAGTDYIEFVGQMLRGEADMSPKRFGNYDFRFFESFAEMNDAIAAREAEVGLSRLLAGFAWPWKSRKGDVDFDIEIEGIRYPWNRRNYDWVNSPTSPQEVGSIHTIQGYDLNYAGVIIGPDLGYDEASQRIVFRRENYYDAKGKENNPKLGIVYTDDDLLKYVTSIYRVLLTRGINGTYIYVFDPALRKHLSGFFPKATF